jgi:hypothetical protein
LSMRTGDADPPSADWLGRDAYKGHKAPVAGARSPSGLPGNPGLRTRPPPCR